MGGAAPNAGFHPRGTINGRRWRMFKGEGGVNPIHDGPLDTNGDDVDADDTAVSKLILAARMSYDIENEPNRTVNTDVFAKAIDAYAPTEWGTWYGNQTTAWQELIRDNVSLMPDLMVSPAP